MARPGQQVVALELGLGLGKFAAGFAASGHEAGRPVPVERRRSHRMKRASSLSVYFVSDQDVWCQYPLLLGNPAMSFWIRCSTRATRKCFAHSVASVLLGLTVFMAPMPRALAQKVPTDTGILGSPDGPVYPLKASGNNRFLVDQNNTPFLMVGDSPQHLISNLSQKEAAAFMANRRGYGINTLWINLLCIFTEASCNREAKTFDGIAPFLVPGDIATPNPAYFQRVDDVLRIAADHGMVVLLDPIETISWLDVLRKNGESKAFGYGQYLGNRYKDFPNIIWMHGNDFQSWRNAADDALAQAVARGIRSIDANHIHTVELNFETSGSLEDKSWAPLIELNAAYTYFPTYAQVLTEYNRQNFKPVFMVEAYYEFEGPGTDGGKPYDDRNIGRCLAVPRDSFMAAPTHGSFRRDGKRTWIHPV